MPEGHRLGVRPRPPDHDANEVTGTACRPRPRIRASLIITRTARGPARTWTTTTYMDREMFRQVRPECLQPRIVPSSQSFVMTRAAAGQTPGELVSGRAHRRFAELSQHPLGVRMAAFRRLADPAKRTLQVLFDADALRQT